MKQINWKYNFVNALVNMVAIFVIFAIIGGALYGYLVYALNTWSFSQMIGDENGVITKFAIYIFCSIIGGFGILSFLNSIDTDINGPISELEDKKNKEDAEWWYIWS